MAGEDAGLPMVCYPTAIQETLDLCIDVTVRGTTAVSKCNACTALLRSCISCLSLLYTVLCRGVQDHQCS